MANKDTRLNFRLSQEFNDELDQFISEWNEYEKITKTGVIIRALLDYLIHRNVETASNKGNAFYVHFNQEHFEVSDVEKAITDLLVLTIANKKQGNEGVYYLIKQLQDALLQQQIYEKDIALYGDHYNQKRNDLRINKRAKKQR